MLKLQEVLDFIQNSDQLELGQIMRVSSIRKSEVNYDAKQLFRVGDKVGIEHEKINPDDVYIINKINRKNIIVSKEELSEISPSIFTWRVDTGLLSKK